MVETVRTWNWYDGSHDDIAGREEEMMEIEVVVITESGEDMIWGVMVVVGRSDHHAVFTISA